jgi:WhiB family transcriptional regulator, redox-sensing transcriptional regulator
VSMREALLLFVVKLSQMYIRRLNDDWIADAACKGTDTTIFFPTRGVSTAPAKAICAECPVRMECCERAIAMSLKSGIFGGLSERERRRVRRVRSIARKAGLVAWALEDNDELEDE